MNCVADTLRHTLSQSWSLHPRRSADVREGVNRRSLISTGIQFHAQRFGSTPDVERHTGSKTGGRPFSDSEFPADFPRCFFTFRSETFHAASDRKQTQLTVFTAIHGSGMFTVVVANENRIRGKPFYVSFDRTLF